MKFHFRNHTPCGPYENTALADWTDWTWQLKNSLRSKAQFANLYRLSKDELDGFIAAKDIFNIRTTPYYATLADPLNPLDPIRLIQTPIIQETREGHQEMRDPLNEEKNSVNSRLVHRYPDRVLFLVTDFCSVYCRYCTRKRFTGQSQAFIESSDYAEALKYLRDKKGIREVIISGGDPLTLSDDKIESVLSDLRRIDHIEIVRIGSRMPTVNPFRITARLLAILKKYKPVFFMAHFNHPREITKQSGEALESLVDHGIPTMNQMVLLNGINNHAAIVQALARRLLYLRVKPYYMFQCDPSLGTDHLRTSIDDSLQIQKELWGNLSGLAMSNLSVDIPGGGGKVGFVPDFLQSRDKNQWNFTGFDGVKSEYVDPDPSAQVRPQVEEEYLSEWQELKASKQ